MEENFEEIYLYQDTEVLNNGKIVIEKKDVEKILKHFQSKGYYKKINFLQNLFTSLKEYKEVLEKINKEKRNDG